MSSEGKSFHNKLVPSEDKIWSGPPISERPVPPWLLGIVKQSILKVPSDVIRLGEIDKKGVLVEREIDVTVPWLGSVNSKASPSSLTVKIWFGNPKLVKPVPPEDTGKGVEEREISKDPDDVIYFGDTERNDGTDIDTDFNPISVDLYSRPEPSSLTVKIWFGWPRVESPVPP